MFRYPRPKAVFLVVFNMCSTLKSREYKNTILYYIEPGGTGLMCVFIILLSSLTFVRTMLHNCRSMEY